MRIRTLLTLVAFLPAFSIAFAQLGKKGIPDDLSVSKVIFLRYDSVALPEDKPSDKREKMKVANQKKYNREVPKANDELTASSKKYPFDYAIARRDELDNYKSNGYKYALDFQPFSRLKEGEMQADADVTESYPLFLQDLTSGEVFIIEYVDQSFAYEYSAIIEKVFLKEVKKKYKLR